MLASSVLTKTSYIFGNNLIEFLCRNCFSVSDHEFLYRFV